MLLYRFICTYDTCLCIKPQNSCAIYFVLFAKNSSLTNKAVKWRTGCLSLSVSLLSSPWLQNCCVVRSVHLNCSSWSLMLVSPHFRWRKKIKPCLTNSLELSVTQLTMSSLYWQMDTSLTKKPGKTLTLKERSVEQKNQYDIMFTKTFLAPITAFCYLSQCYEASAYPRYLFSVL